MGLYVCNYDLHIGLYVCNCGRSTITLYQLVTLKKQLSRFILSSLENLPNAI